MMRAGFSGFTRRGFLGALPPAGAFGALPDAAATVSKAVLESYMAIDHVCAWPKLTTLRDGAVAAAIFNRPSHGQELGDVECWVSADRGRNWKRAGVAASHKPGTSRLNHAIGLAPNGDLLIIAGGWKMEAVSGKGSVFRKMELLRPWVCRSRDGGITWTVSENFPDGPDGLMFVPFGNIVAGADGHLRVAAYVYRPWAKPRYDTCCVLRSDDGGNSWQVFSTLGDRYHNETDIEHLGGGRWLAAARTLPTSKDVDGGPGPCTDLLESSDDGRTWKLLGPVSRHMEMPGDLCRLGDGRVVLTYGRRRPECLGVAGRVSSDGGKSWSEPLQLAQALSGDCGYPSSVPLPDGTVLTAYYSRSSPQHTRYHMGVVIWNPDAH
jgi:hypothetical protein